MLTLHTARMLRNKVMFGIKMKVRNSPCIQKKGSYFIKVLIVDLISLMCAHNFYDLITFYISFYSLMATSIVAKLFHH